MRQWTDVAASCARAPKFHDLVALAENCMTQAQAMSMVETYFNCKESRITDQKFFDISSHFLISQC